MPKHKPMFALLAGLTLLVARAVTAEAPATQPANMLKDTEFQELDSIWPASSQGDASVSASRNATGKSPAMMISVDKVDDTDWHAQIAQSNLSVTKGAKYKLSFTAKASSPRKIGAFIQMQDDPYTLLTEGRTVDLTTNAAPQQVDFTATGDSTAAKLTITVGQATGTVTITDISLTKTE